MVIQQEVIVVGRGPRLGRNIHERHTGEREVDGARRKALNRIADAHLALEGPGVGTAESMGEDLSAAMGSAVEAYTSLPPIITVAPGAAITVMVDRDLEIW